jgi:TRAP-type C4-dicarboxylate transport system permease small subunit
MVRLLDLYHKLLVVLLGLLVALIIVPVTLQILSRYTSLIPTFLWTEEVARFCLIWTIMIGATVAVREGTHFDIDLWSPPRTPLGRLLSRLAVHIALLGFGGIFLYGGWEFAEFGMMQISEITEVSLVTIYVAFPLAALGWIVFTLEALARDVARYREAVHVAS